MDTKEMVEQLINMLHAEIAQGRREMEAEAGADRERNAQGDRHGEMNREGSGDDHGEREMNREGSGDDHGEREMNGEGSGDDHGNGYGIIQGGEGEQAQLDREVVEGEGEGEGKRGKRKEWVNSGFKTDGFGEVKDSVFRVSAEADGGLMESGVDLVTLLGEMTAIKAEIRKETEAFRRTRDGLAEALETLKRELENSGRRERELRKEIEHIGAETDKKVARALIDIADRLEPALDAGEGKGEGRGEGRSAKSWWMAVLSRWLPKNVHALRQGIALTLENIDSRLREMEVFRMKVVGEKFDPHRMCVVDTSIDCGTPDGVVTRQVRSGYLMESRVLRPAQVVVNRTE